jgi:hypothetical protein
MCEIILQGNVLNGAEDAYSLLVCRDVRVSMLTTSDLMGMQIEWRQCDGLYM